MSDYLSKLKPKDDCFSPYFVNNVIVGLQWAIEDPKIKKHDSVLIELEKLYKHTMDLPFCQPRGLPNDSELEIMRKVQFLQEEAFELVCDL